MLPIEAKRPRPGRQADILTAFTENVADRGYDQTAISDIAKQLGISKGTIMHHFGSKDRMLQQMSYDYMSRRIAEVASIIERCPTIQQQLAAIITAQITAYRDDRPATLAFSRELMRFANDPVNEDVRALRREFTGTLRGVLSEGMAKGIIRNSDAGAVALQIIGMCNWCWTWLRPDGRLTVDEVARIFVATVLGGLLKDRKREGPDVGSLVARIRQEVARSP